MIDQKMPRPVWLLDEPLPLPKPEILQGPERIESGWWDGKGVARDYYVAPSVPMAPGYGFFRSASPSAGICTAYSLRELSVYVELHALSNFSFLRGASQPEELVAQAKALNYAGLALTDECSLAGVVRAHIAAKEHGLPLIIGTELNCVDELKLVVLATDRASYGAMSRLISKARRATRKGCYALTRTDLENALPGCLIIWLPRCRQSGAAAPGGRTAAGCASDSQDAYGSAWNS